MRSEDAITGGVSLRFREVPGTIMPFRCPGCGTESFVIADGETGVETVCVVCSCVVLVWREEAPDGT